MCESSVVNRIDNCSPQLRNDVIGYSGAKRMTEIVNGWLQHGMYRYETKAMAHYYDKYNNKWLEYVDLLCIICPFVC